MKKVLSGVAALLMVSSVGLASPLNDFSQGKVAVDVSVRASNDLSSNHPLFSLTKDGKASNFNYGITVGLGNNFAFQYKRDNADSKDLSLIGGTYHTNMQSNQYNVLYKLDSNLSAFAGITNSKAGFSALGLNYDTKNAVGYQVGLVGSVPIADKLTAYASAGYGNKIEDYEIGLGYAFTKNVELNIGYKDTKYKKLELEALAGEFYYKAHGLVYGLTYKF